MANGDDKQALAKLDPGSLIQQAIEHNSGVETLERLLDMATKVRDREARDAWHEAMARFQAEAPTLPKSRTAHVRMKQGGSYSYNYASLDAIIPVLRPVLARHGLSVTYKTTFAQGCVTAICRVAHERGHVEETEFLAPVDTEARMSAPQQMGAASTYARRYALLAALGLAPEDDPDAAGVQSSAQSVQMPQRQTDAPAPAASAEISVETTIDEIEEKTGKKKNGDTWTRYGIKCGNGEIYGTFSKTVAEAARPFVGTGEPVTVWYTDDGKYRTAMGVVPASGPDA